MKSEAQKNVKLLEKCSTKRWQNLVENLVGRHYGSPNPRKTNVQKIKETFGPKKNVPSKLKGFSKLPEKVQQQMNKKLARKV